MSPDRSADDIVECIGSPGYSEGDAEEDGGAEFQALEEFRRMVFGARRLPWRERRQALRMASEQLRSAFNAIRERRLRERRVRHAYRQRLQMLRGPRL